MRSPSSQLYRSSFSYFALKLELFTNPFQICTKRMISRKSNDFLALKTVEDLADFLKISKNRLIFRIYKLSDLAKYITFFIPKKSGGSRAISAPTGPIKNIQRKLCDALNEVYMPKKAVHGFIKKGTDFNRNIVSNASTHSRQKYVFNIDLKDFFPSINFGRVRGMFMNYPFDFSPQLATVLAQICCFKNQLPQGAPTSPIVSNLICARLDYEIIKLTKSSKCFYTRYADDLTFSTSLKEFPKGIATIFEEKVKIGDELERIIKGNGFEINPVKSRIAYNFQRQVVTGITVNEFPNVSRKFLRQLRAMIYAWDKFGLEKAELEFHAKYDKVSRNPENKKSIYSDIVQGKLSFLRFVRDNSAREKCQSQDRVYKRLYDELRECKSRANIMIHYDKASPLPLIITEGKTDWRHLKIALARLREVDTTYCPNGFDFLEYNDELKMGNTNLLRLCKNLPRINENRPIICLFDRDDEKIINKITGNGKDFKQWGKNVFSFILPVPSHRIDNPQVSIEMYYKDTEIMRVDQNGRRLFLSNEFNKPSGRHKNDPNIICQYKSKRFTKDILMVIDDEVYNEKEEKIVMKKSGFAEHVFQKTTGFDNFDYSEFKKIFDSLNEMIDLTRVITV